MLDKHKETQSEGDTRERRGKNEKGGRLSERDKDGSLFMTNHVNQLEDRHVEHMKNV